MSYQISGMSNPSSIYRPGVNNSIQQYVPNYVVHSDYLPSNRILDGNESKTSQLLRTYQQQKSLGRVYTQRPPEFNPSRYVSYRTYENVRLNEPIPETQFQRIQRRY